MNCECKLSNVTKKYLDRFYCILEEMIHGMTDVDLTDSISDNFIIQMIPHHEGAIKMSHNALQYNICPELKPILQAIISSQEKGVRQMKQLLSCM